MQTRVTLEDVKAGNHTERFVVHLHDPWIYAHDESTKQSQGSATRSLGRELIVPLTHLQQLSLWKRVIPPPGNIRKASCVLVCLNMRQLPKCILVCQRGVEHRGVQQRRTEPSMLDLGSCPTGRKPKSCQLGAKSRKSLTHPKALILTMCWIFCLRVAKGLRRQTTWGASILFGSFSDSREISELMPLASSSFGQEA